MLRASPPRHVECDTPENTVRFIERVQNVSELPVGIKLCLGHEEEFQTLVREMKRQGVFPDYIALDGAQGGTGAAPAAFLDHVGVPLCPALDHVHRLLVEERVRERMKLVASGKLVNPSSQLKALAHGADAVATARGFMLALGCIQALHCNTDNFESSSPPPGAARSVSSRSTTPSFPGVIAHRGVARRRLEIRDPACPSIEPATNG